MTIPPPRSPAERLAATLMWLSQAAVTQGLLGRLAGPLLAPIIDRIRGISQSFRHLAARIGAGRYKPRQVTAPRHRRATAPRRPDPLPRTAGWLLQLVPDAVGARAQLEHLFREPAMIALIAAAPGALRRPLRSLCRMLGATPPPALALPPRPRPSPQSPPRATPQPPAPPPEQPAWMRIGPQRRPWSLTRIRGSPRRG